MTRPALRDVVYVSLLVSTSSLLGLQLWTTWRVAVTPATTTAVLGCSAVLVLLVATRELVDLQIAVLRAQRRKWEAEAEVAESIRAQMREIDAARVPIHPLQPPMPRH